ncbi:MAG: carbamoyl phosphate synthase small subunit, partial [Proteobacteria bacterium]|nr:carbamoyl phosphate synthase small subunit [Pseudomonadota bacterium]
MTDAKNPVIPAGTASRGKGFSSPANAALVLATGEVFWGRGAGATGRAVGEVCFNTSITGYQEILT